MDKKDSIFTYIIVVVKYFPGMYTNKKEESLILQQIPPLTRFTIDYAKIARSGDVRFAKMEDMMPAI